MKANRKMRFIQFIGMIGVFVLVGTILLVMSSCGIASSDIYPNGERYSFGDAAISDLVKNIAIDWKSGNVDVKTHDDSGVLIAEEIDETATDELRVHWWLDGTTLRIRYTASGVKLKTEGFTKKNLTVTLPQSIRLSDVKISAASADVKIDDMHAEKISVSTASGSMAVACESKTLQMETASGEINLYQSGESEKILLNTASGNIKTSIEQAKKATVETASGKLDLTAEKINVLKVDTSSGKIECALSVAPDRCELDTASGDIRLLLPETAGFRAKVSSSSRDFSSDFTMKKMGDVYFAGDGSADIELGTCSGDVHIGIK